MQKAMELQLNQGGLEDVDETEIEIPMRDGHQNKAIVFKDKRATNSRRPLIVLVYGGGFMAGTIVQLSFVAQPLARLYGATVVSVSYRLSPEHKFPIPPNDVWDNIEWLSRNATSLGADPLAGFVIGGASAGANLAAVAIQKAVKTKLSPPVTGYWSFVPFLLEEEIVPEKYAGFYIARKQNACAPGLDDASIKEAIKNYQFDVKSPDFSPFNDPASFSGLPRTYVQACGLDPVRDDAIIYAKTLADHEVECKLDVYPGVPHGFEGQFTTLKSARQYRIDTLANFGWLLGATPEMQDIENLV
ncbi:Alpha/Beta hydrolase protein [Aspergillus keveii]|uniref:Alpha/Beta hydrolase protein n=1 Tax=Aspergillus keveii TaxID=714993 RepID=A0ABR4FMG5_9EURO